MLIVAPVRATGPKAYKPLMLLPSALLNSLLLLSPDAKTCLLLPRDKKPSIVLLN